MGDLRVSLEINTFMPSLVVQIADQCIRGIETPLGNEYRPKIARKTSAPSAASSGIVIRSRRVGTRIYNRLRTEKQGRVKMLGIVDVVSTHDVGPDGHLIQNLPQSDTCRPLDSEAASERCFREPSKGFQYATSSGRRVPN